MRRISIDLDDLPGTFDAIAQALGGREAARTLVDELRTVARLQRPALEERGATEVPGPPLAELVASYKRLFRFLVLARGIADPELAPSIYGHDATGDAARLDVVLAAATHELERLDLDDLFEVRPFEQAPLTVDERGQMWLGGCPVVIEGSAQ